MTKQEIEDYINIYRAYPKEYTGRRDKGIILYMQWQYRFNLETNEVTQPIGEINENGDFEIIGIYTYPLGDHHNRKLATNVEQNRSLMYTTYNRIVTDLGYEDRVVSEDNNKDWTPRDLVAEIDYIRSLYVYDGPMIYLKKEDNMRYTKELARLHYFLRSYGNALDGIPATIKHNSKYDNQEVNNE